MVAARIFDRIPASNTFTGHFLIPCDLGARFVVLLGMKAALAMLVQAVPAHHARSPLLHFMMGMGLFGLFLVAIVDSSFVPLPVPGMTDILIIVFAAQHANVILLVVISTVGSAIGGWFSHRVGQAGGMTFLEKHVPPRILKPVCRWMEEHAILAVALPAILPPPAPLSPFVLAAGALNMPRRKFMIAFTTSRAARHAVAAWLGIRYGRHVIRLWNSFSDKWATTFLIVLWSLIAIGVGFALWKLWQTSRAVGVKPASLVTPQRTQS